MNSEPFALLYDDFIASGNDPDMIIEFYHKNALFFNNIKSITNTYDLDAYIMIINKYARALWEKKRFTKCVEFIDDRLPFIDQEINKLKAPEVKTEGYYYILFYKAASLYDKQNFNAAHPIFIELTEYDPQNELFSNWLKHTDQGVNMKILRILSIIGAIMIVGGFILKYNIPNKRYISLIPNIGLLIVLGSTVCEYYLKYKLKKK